MTQEQAELVTTAWSIVNRPETLQEKRIAIARYLRSAEVGYCNGGFTWRIGIPADSKDIAGETPTLKEAMEQLMDTLDRCGFDYPPRTGIECKLERQ